MNAALDNEQAIVRYQPCQPQRRLKRDIEGFQVAVVHSDDRRPGLERLAQFGLIVNLDQRVELELLSEGDKFLQFARLKHGDDQ